MSCSTWHTNWIPVTTETMPPVETKVLVLIKRKKSRNKDSEYLTTTAMYEDGTVRENESIWNWDYLDGEFVPEGWQEYHEYLDPDFEEDPTITDEVVGWMPLPQMPDDLH